MAFPFCALRLLFHCLLTYIIFTEKSGVYSDLCSSLCNMFFCPPPLTPGSFLDFFLLWLLLSDLIMLCPGVVFFMFLCTMSLSFLDLWVIVFFKFGKILAINSSRIFLSFPFFSLADSDCPYISPPWGLFCDGHRSKAPFPLRTFFSLFSVFCFGYFLSLCLQVPNPFFCNV